MSKQSAPIKLRKVNAYLDGGTVLYLSEDGVSYYEDRRLGTKTPGEIYSSYPGEPNAKMLKKADFDLVTLNEDKFLSLR